MCTCSDVGGGRCQMIKVEIVRTAPAQMFFFSSFVLRTLRCSDTDKLPHSLRFGREKTAENHDDDSEEEKHKQNKKI